MATAKLTSSQKALMLKSLRADGMVYVSRQRYRTAFNLVRKGYMYEGSDGAYSHTREGLEALLYDRKLEDCRSGSMASMANVAEVEAALASAQVPA